MTCNYPNDIFSWMVLLHKILSFFIQLGDAFLLSLQTLANVVLMKFSSTKQHVKNIQMHCLHFNTIIISFVGGLNHESIFKM